MPTIKNLEDKISNTFYQIRTLQYHIFHLDLIDDYKYEEDRYDTKEEHNLLIKKLHNQIICYLDNLKLDNYLKIFLNKLDTTPDVNSIYKDIDFDPMNSKIQNNYMDTIESFLSPFNILTDESLLQQSGIQYLNVILKNTSTILHKLNKVPSSEVDVYNSVKFILNSIFPSSKDGKSNFIKTMKEYKPDILIPELSVAIEYKFAKNETKLKSTIEQIAADVKGYTGDNDYKIFYAVFYVTNDFWGIDKFKSIWKENNFPKNWKAYYIVGNSNA